jgi:large subunit ribosomal protein L18e
MAQKVKKTNPLLIHLINELKKQSLEKEAPIWKDIALRLEKSHQNWAEVNLKRISAHIHDKETALVPGKVLSTGTLTKKVTIAAWSFSDKAIDKIKKAGGTSVSIEELMKKNPEGKNIRIMG